MRGEVLGVERRRRWDDEVKLAIVSAVGIDGATVTQVAQRHEVTRQQIYAWRHELKRKGLWSPEAGALFLPAGIVPAMELTVVEPPARAAAPVAWVELRVAKAGYGRTLGRWFNDVFLVKLGLKAKSFVFHSFRHSKVSQLAQANVQEPIYQCIVGHERKGVTQQVYNQSGFTLVQLKDAIDLFKL